MPNLPEGPTSGVGVLLCNVGTPAAPTPAALRRYLAEFLGDSRIVELPGWLWQPLLRLAVHEELARLWADPPLSQTRKAIENYRRAVEYDPSSQFAIYSVRELPSPWNHISLFNPMVYMVEGLRYGMLGQSGFSPLLGAGILVAVALAATGVAWAALRSGYKLKA